MKLNPLEKPQGGDNQIAPQKLEKKLLIPISGKIPDDAFVKSIGLLQKKQEQLTDQEVIEICKLVLPILIKDGKEEDVVLLNKIIVGNISEGRYSMDIRTTGSKNNPARVGESNIIFDIESKNLDDLYPARENHWIIGEKQGQKELIEKYKEIFEKSSGKVQEFLASQGYSNFSEAWISDFDRHVGFLKKNGSISE